jgi:hypothetical protein
VDIQLDAVTMFLGGTEGCHTVFRHTLTVQASVGIVPSAQGGQTSMAGAAFDQE